MAKQKYWDGTKWVQVAPSMKEFNEHLADDASLTKKGHVQLSNATNSTSNVLAATPSAVKKAMDKANEAFTSASNGKQLVGNAITGVDDSVTIPTNPTFQQLASAIGSISAGKKWASGFIPKGGKRDPEVRNLDFTPSFVGILQMGDGMPGHNLSAFGVRNLPSVGSQPPSFWSAANGYARFSSNSATRVIDESESMWYEDGFSFNRTHVQSDVFWYATE